MLTNPIAPSGSYCRERAHIGRFGRRPTGPAMRVAAQVNLVLLRCSQPGAVSPKRINRRIREQP
jgi:hypothetical protein